MWNGFVGRRSNCGYLGLKKLYIPFISYCVPTTDLRTNGLVGSATLLGWDFNGACHGSAADGGMQVQISFRDHGQLAAENLALRQHHAGRKRRQDQRVVLVTTGSARPKRCCSCTQATTFFPAHQDLQLPCMPSWHDGTPAWRMEDTKETPNAEFRPFLARLAENETS